MRIFARILYATFMVGLFLLAFTYPRELMRDMYLEDVFMEPLTNETSEYPEFYYFYTAIPDYHNDQELFRIESHGYIVVGYEVLKAELDANNDLVTTESIYFIVYSYTEDLSVLDYMRIYNDSTSEYIDVTLHRFQNLNILNGVNEDSNVYVLKTDILNEFNYNKISLVDDDDYERANGDFVLAENQFITKTFVEDFYNNNNRLPGVSDFEGLTDNHILTNLTHVTDDYAYIFTYAMVAYFVVLIVTTYLVFFRKRKNRNTN